MQITLQHPFLVMLGLGLAGFLASWFFTRVLASPNPFIYILDHPNERSSHTEPTPRTGGLAILLVLAAGAAIWLAVIPQLASNGGYISLGALTIAAISLWDDFNHIPALWRLLVHLFGSAMLGLGGLFPETLAFPGVEFTLPFWLVWLFGLLFSGWFVNLYNFMDGMDGFAGGMAVIGFGTLAIIGWRSDDLVFCLASLLVAAAAAGFLTQNFPPAKIFMGDVGSSLLGYLAAAFSLWGDVRGLFPLWIPVLAFSPFVVDATTTLTRRLLLREKVWQAHKKHYFQRLVQLGWGVKQTVLVEYLLMVAAGFSAVACMAMETQGQWRVLAVWGLFWAGFIAYIHHKIILAKQAGRPGIH